MHFRLHCPGRGEARGWPWPHRQAGRGLRALVPCLGFDSPGALGGGRGPARHCVPHLGCLLQIQDIVRRRQLLTIFREGKDGQHDVDVAILQALLKGEGQAKWGP